VFFSDRIVLPESKLLLALILPFILAISIKIAGTSTRNEEGSLMWSFCHIRCLKKIEISGLTMHNSVKKFKKLSRTFLLAHPIQVGLYDLKEYSDSVTDLAKWRDLEK